MKVFISYPVFLGVLLLSISAAACDCFKPDAIGGLKYAEIAFRGELIEHSGSYAIFRVDEWWKGDLGRTVKFEWRDGSHGDCDGFWPELLKVGNKMLVFGKRDIRGFYKTSICLPTELVSEAKDNLTQLGPGKPPRKD